MDLKTILEKENHSVDTSLLGYDFHITAERNIYNAIRNKYKKLAIAAREKFEKMDGELSDISDLLDNSPNAFVVAIEDAILELLQDMISVDIYTVDKDAVVEMAFNGEYFDEFSEAYNVFSNKANEIIEEVDDAAYARQLRKESRPRWTSATIGGNAINAWSHQLDAVGMNLIEGAAHTAFNAIENAITRSWADGELKKLFQSKHLRQDMIDGVYYSCFNLHYLLLDVVKKHSQIEIGGTVSEQDAQKAKAMFNNFVSLNLDEEKKAKLINDIFQLDPYEREYYKILIEKFGDESKEFESFSDFSGMNSYEIKNEILVDFVEKHLGETEADAYKCKDETEALAKKIGLDQMLIVQAYAIISKRLEELDLLYRTVDDIVFDTREEADLAKEELSKIQEIMKTISAPNKESTLSYENDLREKQDNIKQFQTAVKEKYIEKIEKYLADFDKKFRGENFFSSGMTREDAGNEKALKYVKTLPVDSYENLDKARELLIAYLPEVGITIEQATLANEYFNRCEASLNTVDGVQFNTREEADYGRQEYREISSIMEGVIAPTSESLLPYEKDLLDKKSKLQEYKTPIKEKYISKIDRYLASFDTLFKTSGFNKFETRKEAAIHRSLAFVKKINPITYEDIESAKEQLKGFVSLVGIEYEEAVSAHQLLQDRYMKNNTVDGIVFPTKDEADFGRKEYAEISAIMNGVVPPTKDSLLSYEKNLFVVREQLQQFKTDIKNKYIAIINQYLEKFDMLFKQTGMFTKAETREAAAQEKALKLVKSIAPSTCSYADVDRAKTELEAFLPEIGIDLAQAFAATQYIQTQEDRLNTVDGVVFTTREECALANDEFSEIQKIMSMVVAPTSDSLLDYEQKLLSYKAELEKFQTTVKNKYLGIVQKYLLDFDEKFRRVSLIKTCSTREEAAKERALKFVKSKTYNVLDDVSRAKNELIALLPNLGIALDQATEAVAFLTNTENKINGVSTGSKFGDFMSKFKK